MAKYHINPKTGAVGLCRARIQCRFGGAEDHHDSKEAAQAAYEKKMNPVPSPKKAFSMELSPGTQAIVDRLSAVGARPLLVGGCVRDTFLGKESKDVDFEVYGARPDGSSLELEDLAKVFKNDPKVRVDEAGASFAVLKVKAGREDFDIALPRTEQSTGDHHRDYDVQHDSTMTFEEAASRRDFTINSMAYDPVSKELLDPYGGAEDLKKGVLRHVGPAFSDDPLRCLRAVNFASRFGYEVAPETKELCRKLAPSYSTLAKERVEEEFNKLFYKGEKCEAGLTTLHDIGWAEQMPPFKRCTREELTSYGKILNHLPKETRKFGLSTLMQDDGHPDPTKTIDSTNSTPKTNSLLTILMKAEDKADRVAAHRALKKANPELKNATIASTFKALGRESEFMGELPEVPVAPVVTGGWLIERGHKPGPPMGELMRKTQRVQDATGLSDPEEIFRRAQEL